MSLLFEPSLIGLLLQAAVGLLISALCAMLLRTVRRQPMVYWAVGWSALTVGLAALWVAVATPGARYTGQVLYLLNEYAFGYLLIIGCRQYAIGQGPMLREAWLVVPGVGVALWLPRLGGGDFNIFFTVHTLIYACLFFLAFRTLSRARPHGRSAGGVRVMKIALVLLALDYMHYAPLFAASSFRLMSLDLPYLAYAPLYDMIVEVMLMFGMVMVVTGDVQHALEQANSELGRARDRLEAMAHLDHLTSALTRHAFYSMLEPPGPDKRVVFRGCAAVADIDELKAINDHYGHAAGDAAIRAMAAALRSCIRADDLLFRWGGDEFLVLLIGVGEPEARARLASLNARLRQTPVGAPGAVDLSASVGFAPFESAASLDEVIALADNAMYEMKKRAS